MSNVQFGTNTPSLRKMRLYYEGTSTIYEGMPVCYNYDTTSNILGWDNDASQAIGTTTDEGYQNEGKFMRVENPATANLSWFAGVVAQGGYCGKVGPKWLDVYEPNGAIMPIRTNASCTVGATVLGIGNGLQYFAINTGDGDPLPVALAEETVDRSGTNGIVLAKVNAVSAGVVGLGAYFAPVRPVVTGYMYGVSIDGTNMLTGTAASKSYVFSITGSRESAAASGDSNDAMLKLTGNNYGACDTNFVFAGLNAVVNNRSGGTLGRITNTISISLKSGSTAAYAYGLQVDAQDLAASAKTEFGGLDVALNREGLAATTEWGIKIRTRGTINSAINAAIRVQKDATDYGFTYLLNIPTAGDVGVIAASGDLTFTSADKLIPVRIGSTTYYLVATDNV
jgi:hypothetical protein